MLVDILQKNKERIQKFRETEESKYIYQNKPDKACFQHNMTYIYFKNLSRRTAADKILRDKAKNPKCDGYQWGLPPNKELAKELNKSIIKNLKNGKYSRLL